MSTKESVQYAPFGTVTLPLIVVSVGWPPMRPEHVVSAAAGAAAASWTNADATNASPNAKRVVIAVPPHWENGTGCGIVSGPTRPALQPSQQRFFLEDCAPSRVSFCAAERSFYLR